MDLKTAVEARHQQFSAFQSSLRKLCVDLEVRCENQKKELIAYKTKANYWETQFSQLKAREQTLLSEVDELKAALKKREQQLFGRGSEKQTTHQDRLNAEQAAKAKKPRGQQLGSKGHGRRDYGHLPVIDEDISLADASCPCCHLPYQELHSTEDSEVLEIIDVKAYRRALHRKRYKRSCQCPKNPDAQLLSAPVVEKLLPKSRLGISIWAKVLLGKFGYQQPLHRLLDQLRDTGLSLSSGTVTDGLKRLLPLFVPIYDAIVARSLSASHWHADETGWKVFESVEGKKNHRWFLWIFHNSDTVAFKISPWRSSQVLIDHFGEAHAGGTLNVDRYSAYKAIAKAGLFILAFCWAHVRRDFLAYAKGYPHEESWGLAWVEEIANIYHLNKQRLAYPPKSKPFRKAQGVLKNAIDAMCQKAKAQCEEKTRLPSQIKLLKSLLAHWGGLTIFIDHPEIPMDNNIAERGLRSSVVGRKNYYGSGAVWSANLAAIMFTIIKTLKLHHINPHTWLLAYLHECAMHGGKPPEKINAYFPWDMSEELKQRFSQPPEYEDAYLQA